tara:strand:+ start:302 stop:733 length:432 start_codon:yes stop_codon:yes gene_type:complete
MAVPTGSGTETLHSALFEDVANSAVDLITGVQHHIYTVLSVTARCVGVDSSTSNRTVYLYITGYDSTAGASAQTIYLANWQAVDGETFVWNDKISFFGYEPSSNTQSARAAQAGSTAQYLKMLTADADTKLDVTCTYIDQDWS